MAGEIKNGYALVTFSPGKGQDVIQRGDSVTLPYETPEQQSTFESYIRRGVLGLRAPIGPPTQAAPKRSKPRAPKST